MIVTKFDRNPIKHVEEKANCGKNKKKKEIARKVTREANCANAGIPCAAFPAGRKFYHNCRHIHKYCYVHDIAIHPSKVMHLAFAA